MRLSVSKSSWLNPASWFSALIRLPVLVGVNGLNLAALLAFAGEEIDGTPTEAEAVTQWCLAKVAEPAACSV